MANITPPSSGLGPAMEAALDTDNDGLDNPEVSPSLPASMPNPPLADSPLPSLPGASEPPAMEATLDADNYGLNSPEVSPSLPKSMPNPPLADSPLPFLPGASGPHAMEAASNGVRMTRDSSAKYSPIVLSAPHDKKSDDVVMFVYAWQCCKEPFSVGFVEIGSWLMIYDIICDEISMAKIFVKILFYLEQIVPLLRSRSKK